MSDIAPTRFRTPRSWHLAYLWQQLNVLLLTGPAFLFATWESPVYQAALAHVPDLPLPAGTFVPATLWLPLVAPIALGLPLVLSRHRTPLLLWLAVVTVALLVGVIEVSRLNWFAFASGVAFRIDSGPVPLVRTVAGLVTLLLGLLLMAQQSVRTATVHLAERGVSLQELRRVQSGLIGLERGILLVAAAAGVVLTIVASVSLSTTEGAPDPDSSLTLSLIWTTLLVVTLLVALGLALWDHHARRRA